MEDEAFPLCFFDYFCFIFHFTDVSWIYDEDEDTIAPFY